MRKIILSSVAAAALTTALIAAGSDIYVFGEADANGSIKTVGGELLSTKAVDINGSDFNASADADFEDAIITYEPDIQMGEGNLIKIEVTNGYVRKIDGNALYLVDLNDTHSSDGNYSVAANMIEKTVDSSGNYLSMTFKFVETVASGHKLAFADLLSPGPEDGLKDDNATGTTNLAIAISKDVKCGDALTVSVTSATDQSGTALTTALAGPSGKINVIKEFGLDCDTNYCAISLPNEVGFGTTDSTSDCPTCANATTDNVLICSSDINMTTNTGVDYGLTVDSHKFTIAGSMIGVSTVKDGTGTSATAYSVSGDTATISYATAPTAEKTVVMTVDGTTKLATRTFTAKAEVVSGSNTIDVDTNSAYLKWTDNTKELTVSYMNSLASYRTFIRVTNASTATAPILAVVTAEDGTASSQFTIPTDANSTSNTSPIPAKGAVVLEGSFLADQAVALGGLSTKPERFAVTLYIKSDSTVDAVAYQTAGTSGSQRYLPVAGATGGAK